MFVHTLIDLSIIFIHKQRRADIQNGRTDGLVEKPTTFVVLDTRTSFPGGVDGRQLFMVFNYTDTHCVHVYCVVEQTQLCRTNRKQTETDTETRPKTNWHSGENT